MSDKKRLLLGGQAGVRVAEETLAPLADGCVRVKVVHSGISPGTEMLALSGRFGAGNDHKLGYQAAGIVMDAAPDLAFRFSPGDRVACYGGPYVHHAEIIDVPKHLITPLPDNVSTLHAGFCGLAAIGLHGFRHTECRIGETVAVIGLGLLGNLAAQCAKAAGCRVVASELLPLRLRAARAVGLQVVDNLDALAEEIQRITDGYGADAVILGVANAGTELLESAFKLVRRLGRVVVLGLSDGILPRELMFSKEASIVVSRAAGWGRYQQAYELEGRDLPYEHARWTEGRNLEEAIRLMGIGGIDLGPLITDEAAIEEAPHIYKELRNNPAEHLAIALRWHTESDENRPHL